MSMGNHGSKGSAKSNGKSNPKSNVKDDPPSSNNAVAKHLSPSNENESKSESPIHKRKQSQAWDEGMVIIHKGFVKMDHFENIYRIEPKVDGAPNFRQCKGFYIFGGGQPTISAHHTLFKAFKDIGLTSVLWFNMRSEPIIYVNNMSYAPRDPEHPSQNIHLPHDITSGDVDNLSIELSKVVLNNAKNNKNIFMYHKDTYALLPQDRIDQILEQPLNFKDFDNKPVKSLMDLYNEYFAHIVSPSSSPTDSDDSKQQNLNNANDFTVHCERLPVNDERAPNAVDIDRLLSILMIHSNKSTAIVFNCQMGKGRTTMGMVMAGLVKKSCNEYYNDLNEEMIKKLEKSNNNTLWPVEIPLISAEASKDDKKFGELNEIKELIVQFGDKYYNGNFTIILNLVRLLSEKYKLDGKTIKSETDDIIDRCQHLQNLRRCIFSTKLRYEYEIIQAKQNKDNVNSNRSEYWKKLSLNFLERYFVMICFNAYLHDTIANHGHSHLTKVPYSEWMDNRPDIKETIGTVSSGPLLKFNWD